MTSATTEPAVTQRDTRVAGSSLPREHRGPPGMVVLAAILAATLEFVLLLLGRDDGVALPVLLASAAALLLGAIAKTSLARFLFEVYALTMVVGVISRLALLAAFSAAPKYERFTTSAQLLRTLDRHSNSLLLLMTLPLVGFAVGDLMSRMMTRRAAQRAFRTPNVRLGPIILGLSAAVLVFNLATPNVIEASDQSGSTNVPLFLIRLIPVGFLPYAALSLLRDPNARQRLVYVSLILLGIAGLVAARKGALLTIPFAALIQLQYFRQAHVKPPRQLRRLVVLGAVLGPLGFATVLAVRLDSAGQPSTADSMEVLSERVSIVDAYASTLDRDPAGLDAVNVGQIWRSSAELVLPAGLITTQPQLGKLFGEFYQGHQSEVRHAGAWTFWGLLDTLRLGRSMYLAILAWALLLVILLRRAEGSVLAPLGLVPFLAERLCFTWLISGNIDRIIALTLLETLTGLLWFSLVPALLQRQQERRLTFVSLPTAATIITPNGPPRSSNTLTGRGARVWAWRDATLHSDLDRSPRSGAGDVEAETVRSRASAGRPLPKRPTT